MTKQCKLLRDYGTTQSRLNEEELRIYLKEHNYKMKETYGKHYTNLDEMKKHFNNCSNVKERMNIIDKMERMEAQRYKLRDKINKLSEAKKALEILKEFE